MSSSRLGRPSVDFGLRTLRTCWSANDHAAGAHRHGGHAMYLRPRSCSANPDAADGHLTPRCSTKWRAARSRSRAITASDCAILRGPLPPLPVGAGDVADHQPLSSKILRARHASQVPALEAVHWLLAFSTPCRQSPRRTVGAGAARGDGVVVGLASECGCAAPAAGADGSPSGADDAVRLRRHRRRSGAVARRQDAGRRRGQRSGALGSLSDARGGRRPRPAHRRRRARELARVFAGQRAPRVHAASRWQGRRDRDRLDARRQPQRRDHEGHTAGVVARRPVARVHAPIVGGQGGVRVRRRCGRLAGQIDSRGRQCDPFVREPAYAGFAARSRSCVRGRLRGEIGCAFDDRRRAA